jgi:hypothetical protein
LRRSRDEKVYGSQLLILKDSTDKVIWMRQALYMSTHERPYCKVCLNLKTIMASAEVTYEDCRPEINGDEAKSKWPRDWREESDRLESEVNLAQAEYRYHLGAEHNDEAYQPYIGQNLDITLGEGRPKS